MEQLKFFDLEHEHKFELRQGPILVQPEIRVAESRWCWTCTSWIKEKK